MGGVYIVDVTKKKEPKVVAQHPTSAHTLFLESKQGKTLGYIADGASSRLSVLDLTTPEAPTLVGVFDVYSDIGFPQIHDLYVDGRAYLNAVDSFIVADIAAPRVSRWCWANGPIQRECTVILVGSRK